MNADSTRVVAALERDRVNRLAAAGKPRRPQVPRLALTKAEVAEALGCSDDFVTAHLWGRTPARETWPQDVVCPVSELESWLDREASRVLD